MTLLNFSRHSTHFFYWVYPIFSMHECNDTIAYMHYKKYLTPAK